MSGGEREEVVRVEGLVKDVRPGFGLVKKRILDDISLTVRRGEIFAFVGPNGAGKTTTLKILMGLIRATEGRATILGHDVGESEFRSQVGFLPENPYFYDFLSGREILTFYAKLSGLPRRERRQRVAQLLDWVGLARAADDRLRTYSKGMLQRIGIAQALVHEPQVVFLDEPMSGLDPIGRKEIRDLIVRLRSEGTTVFMNTHILSDVEMLCDRVAILVEGRIRFVGAVDESLIGVDKEMEITVAGLPTPSALEIEERWGDCLRGVGDRIEVMVPEKQVGELLSVVLACGARVLAVTPRRTSLEARFLSAVEGAELAEARS